jgi:hypothetical protein
MLLKSRLLSSDCHNFSRRGSVGAESRLGLRRRGNQAEYLRRVDGAVIDNECLE